MPNLSAFNRALKRGAACFIVLSLFTQNVAMAADSQPLPELNDSASLVLNAAQEKMLGQQVMLSIRAKTRLSEDALLLDYLSNLAKKLAIHSPRAFGEIEMNLAIDADINAFAVPGGYITLNSGLMEKSESEAELAAVIAHEIGHHSQRHIARRIERSKQLSLPAAAALVAGVLVGGQVGLAAIVSSQAAIGGDQLAYSRNFEREADASGMNILNDAGYPPRAMADFFAKLEQQSRLYGGKIPDFLSSHPVSSDRIADSLSRAENLDSKNTILPAADNGNTLSLDFAHAKARLLALYSESPEQSLLYFKQASKDKTLLSAQYGLSLALMRNGDNAEAKTVLSSLALSHPSKVLIAFSQAELALAANKEDQAVQGFGALYQDAQDNNSMQSTQAINKAYAQALFKQQDYVAASRILRKQIRHQAKAFWAYELLAQIYGAQNKTIHAVLVKAQQQQILGQHKAAIKQLKTALESPHQDKSSYLIARAKDLIKQNKQAQRRLDNFKL